MTTLVLCELAPSDRAAMPEGALPLLLRGEAELLFLGTEPGGGRVAGLRFRDHAAAQRFAVGARDAACRVLHLVRPPADAGPALLFP
jgi:hypothetical protein